MSIYFLRFLLSPYAKLTSSNVLCPRFTKCALQGIYKSDAKSSFGLTDKDIETLPHEAIQNSPKTFYALRDVRKLAANKFAANALPPDFTRAGEPKGGDVRFFKKNNTNPNRRVRTNWFDHGSMPWFMVMSMYLKD